MEAVSKVSDDQKILNPLKLKTKTKKNVNQKNQISDAK